MKPVHDLETRVLEFLEGDLDAEAARAFLEEAERNPELMGLLRRYEAQEAGLRRVFAGGAARADGLRQPVLPAPGSRRATVVTATGRRLSWGLAAAAAAAVVAVGGGAWWATVGGIAPARLVAIHSESGRPVQVLGSDGPVTVQQGALIARSGSVLKTPDGTRASVQLASNRLELNSNSTVTLDRRARLGLERGEVLVWGREDAARQDSVTVTTEGLEVAGRGAVFSVARGLGGAEVAVIEGSVEIRFGGKARTLSAGEVFSTTDSRPLPLSARVAWSDRQTELRRMLDPGTIVEAPAATTTGNASLEEMARYLPESTYSFVATDDLGDVLKDVGSDSLGDALDSEQLVRLRTALGSRAISPTVDAAMTAAGELVQDQRVRGLLDQLGGRLVVAVHGDGLLVMAQVEGDLARAERVVNECVNPALARVEGPQPLAARVERGWLLLGSQNATFDEVVAGLRGDRASAFGNTDFFRSVSRAARSGSFTVGMDPQALIAQAGRHEPRMVPALEQLGIGSVASVVASNGFTDQASNRALRLSFDGERQGLFRWIGAPAPLASARAMAPGTWFYAAMRTDRPTQIVADLMAMGGRDVGLDPALLDDLAQSLGNEVALGLGQPMLPLPKVRLAIEVNDATRFHRSLHALLTSLDGSGAMRVSRGTVGGREVLRFDHPGTSLPIAVGVVRDMAVFTVGQTALEEAWAQAERGESLDNVAAFREALPAKSGTHASMLVYHRTGEDAQQMASLLSLMGISADGKSELSKAPAVLYAVAEDDRIDLYGEGIRNNWDVGRMITTGAGLVPRE